VPVAFVLVLKAFNLSSMASGTFGLPSGNLSPFHSTVRVLMYSGVEPTLWAMMFILHMTKAKRIAIFFIHTIGFKGFVY